MALMSTTEAGTEAARLRQRLAGNLAGIQARAAAAAVRADRKPEEVTVIGVTKSAPREAARVLFELGLVHLAENRVEVAEPKVAALPPGIRWHLIGNLQRRKARKAVELFPYIDAVDRLELAETLQRRCEELEVTRSILLEVNVSGEENKHGVTPGEAAALLSAVRGFERLKVRGVMTMAPFDAPEEVLRMVFGGLRRIAGDLGLPDISMGMTDDFEIAIEEGATEVRIGRALFE
ncbi:MAG: YggS family pyridoxal phosphate-dependent enzyme [Candidatus Hydrogenedens sp.]|nr:YggS family pyridoxal phosphate-dependent enzyme [Candidatus Hydrogenedens sp.]